MKPRSAGVMATVERLRKQLDEARAAIALLISDYDDPAEVTITYPTRRSAS